MPAENHHVRAERAWIHERLTDGIKAGVLLQPRDYPEWVRVLYAERGPYERGLLAGVLLEEMGLLTDEEGES